MSAGTGRSPRRPESCEQNMLESKSNCLSLINKWDQGHEFQCLPPLYNGRDSRGKVPRQLEPRSWTGEFKLDQPTAHARSLPLRPGEGGRRQPPGLAAVAQLAGRQRRGPRVLCGVAYAISAVARCYRMRDYTRSGL